MPFLSKNGPPSGRRTVLNSDGSAVSAWVSCVAADSASSGVWPSMTMASRLVFCGNALSSAALSSCQGKSGSISLPVSVLTDRRCITTSTAQTDSTSAATITHGARRWQKAPR